MQTSCSYSDSQCTPTPPEFAFLRKYQLDLINNEILSVVNCIFGAPSGCFDLSGEKNALFAFILKNFIGNWSITNHIYIRKIIFTKWSLLGAVDTSTFSLKFWYNLGFRPSVQKLILNFSYTSGFTHNLKENSPTVSSHMVLVINWYHRFWRKFLSE